MSWVKCDQKECNNVAWIVLEDPVMEVHVNVCTMHYEELKNERAWRISDLDTGKKLWSGKKYTMKGPIIYLGYLSGNGGWK